MQQKPYASPNTHGTGRTWQPSTIPRQNGKSIKADRIDAAHLAQFCANDLLTVLRAAELQIERDLLRSRQSLVHHREHVLRHLQAVLHRHGLHCKAETQHKSHWAKLPHSWLERTIEAQRGSLKVKLELIYPRLQEINRMLAEYNQQIEELAQTERYQQPVRSPVPGKVFKPALQARAVA